MRTRRESAGMLGLVQGVFTGEVESLFEVRRLVLVRIGIEAAGRDIAAARLALPEELVLFSARQMEEAQAPIEHRLQLGRTETVPLRIKETDIDRGLADLACDLVARGLAPILHKRRDIDNRQLSEIVARNTLA